MLGKVEVTILERFLYWTIRMSILERFFYWTICRAKVKKEGVLDHTLDVMAVHRLPLRPYGWSLMAVDHRLIC